MLPTLQIAKDSSRQGHSQELGGWMVSNGGQCLLRAFVETRIDKFDAGPGCPSYGESAVEIPLSHALQAKSPGSLWETLETEVQQIDPVAMLRFRFVLRKACMVRLVFEMAADSSGGPELRFFPPVGRLTLRQGDIGLKAFSFGNFTMFPQCDLQARTSFCHWEQNVEAGECTFCAVVLIDAIDKFLFWHAHHRGEDWVFENPQKQEIALLSGPPFALQKII
jgi:hypothetical protein